MNKPEAAFTVRAMTMADYDETMALWRSCDGIGLNDSDTPERIAVYLHRNAGLSFVALQDNRIVGAVLGGHDGRRGYLHHLAVAPGSRRHGIGRTLVERVLEGLRNQGIGKCNLFLFATNTTGRNFWLGGGWSAREDLVLIQKTIG
jgi:N-acetylglutamate synthase